METSQQQQSALDPGDEVGAGVQGAGERVGLGELLRQEAAPAALVDRLMLHNAREREAIKDQLMEDMRLEVARLRATLNLIRADIEWALGQPWLPNPNRLRAALYPDKGRIKIAAEEEVGYGSQG